MNPIKGRFVIVSGGLSSSWEKDGGATVVQASGTEDPLVVAARLGDRLQALGAQIVGDVVQR